MLFHWTLNNMVSNDVAISKAQSLAQAHNVKATAYKVDGQLAQSPISTV